MAMLSKESLLRHLARPVVKVDVEALGETIFLREMSAGARAAIYRRFFPNDKPGDFSAFDWNIALVSATLCDESGGLMFSEDEAHATFADGRAEVLDALVDEVRRINRMGGDAVESAEKNSAQTTSGASSSS